MMHLEPETLSQLVERDLEGPSLSAAEAHLRDCASCRSELGALQSLRAELPSLQVQSPDLWPKIRDSLETPGWRRWFSEVRLAWGSAALLGAVSIALGLALLGRPATSAKDELEKTRTAYLAAISRLEAEAVTARSELPPGVRRKVSDSLSAVDNAIAECEQALAENRADPESQKMLVALYEEKIRVLDATIATKHGGKK